MKLRPVELPAEPATMSGVNDKITKDAQAIPAQRRPLFHRKLARSLRDSNIQKKENGIAAAEANASRPNRIFGSESLVDR